MWKGSKAGGYSPAALGPVWQAGSLSFNLTVGTPFSLNLDSVCTDTASLPITYMIPTGSLPAGITKSGTRGQTISGTPTTAQTTTPTFLADDAPVGTGDWAIRSSASGVVIAVPFATSSDLATYSFAGLETTPPALDSARAPFGQAASIKFTIANADGTQSGTLKVPFGTTFGNGQTVWVSHREYMPPEFVFLVCPTNDNSIQGSKLAIISGITSSNQPMENVWENNLQSGGVAGYWNSAVQPFTNWQLPYGGSGDFNFQPSVLNDGTGTVSPDSVYATVNAPGAIDPDTGSAFTTGQIAIAKAGGTFFSQSDAAFMFGLGHPLGGMVRYPANQWATYLWRIDIGHYGSPDSRVRCYVAPEGQPYYKLTDNAGVQLDTNVAGGGDSGINAVWPMPYYTNRTSGGVSVQSISPSIAAWGAIRVVGLGTVLGAGTLSWNAGTQRFTWAEAGGTAGAPRGVASWKRFVALTTNGGGNAYATAKQLGLEIKNFSALPATNQTYAITIQSGRLATQTNKAELIVSSQPINATAFNAAGVQVGPSGGYVPPP